MPSVPNRLPDGKLIKSAERLHALGSLPLAYFLAELAAGGDLNETLAQYLALTPELVQGVGADSVDASATAAAAALGYVPPRGRA
jgi:hypothetical protein